MGSARRVLSALRCLDSAGADTVGRYLRWLQAIYPGPAALNPLRPDRLGENLVAGVLADDGVLFRPLAAVLTTEQAEQALTVLGRAAGRHPALGPAMTDVLVADAGARVRLGLRVATTLEDAAVLVRALRNVVSEAPEELTDLVVDSLPDSSLALAAFSVEQTRAALALERHRPDPDPGALAAHTHNLALRLEEVGAYEEALEHATDAQLRYRDLAGQEPDFAVDYGSALNTLAIVLGRLAGTRRHWTGRTRPRSGWPVSAPNTPARLVRASVLVTRAAILSDLGREAEGLACAAEAVNLQRSEVAECAPADARDRQTRLATGLLDLGSALSDCGRRREGLAATSQAVEL